MVGPGQDVAVEDAGGVAGDRLGSRHPAPAIKRRQRIAVWRTTSAVMAGFRRLSLP